jgi:hypothetical protein
MADQIGKEDEPADHANLPDADAAKEFSDSGELERDHAGPDS